MGINVNAVNRTDSYIGTFDVLDASDMLQLEDVRAMVKNMNKMLRVDGFGEYQYRVVVRGRKPVEKKKVKNVFTGKTSVRSYDAGGNVIGGIKNATRLDAYIYRRHA